MMVPARARWARLAPLIILPIIGTYAAAYVWWVLGVQLDAADAGTPVPPAAAHGGLALIVLGLSIVGFVVAAGVAYARRPT